MHTLCIWQLAVKPAYMAFEWLGKNKYWIVSHAFFLKKKIDAAGAGFYILFIQH